MALDTNSRILTALMEGSVSIQGEFMWGSNYTFLVQIAQGDLHVQAVYKPTRGVRPLWDFPPETLARREVAAYLVSEALGWGLVPPTIYRDDVPEGPGSLQLFVEHDPEYQYFNFTPADRARLRPVALFDVVVNNADRKASHILVDPAGHMWLIDHGICFHAQAKLRTVIWDFAGEPIPDDACQDLRRLRQELLAPGARKLPESGHLVQQLGEHLGQREIKAMMERIDALLASERFPHPDPNRRHYPWPPV